MLVSLNHFTAISEGPACLMMNEYTFMGTNSVVVVVVVLLFYVHGKHLRSCRDGQLT